MYRWLHEHCTGPLISMKKSRGINAWVHYLAHCRGLRERSNHDNKCLSHEEAVYLSITPIRFLYCFHFVIQMIVIKSVKCLDKFHVADLKQVAVV